MAPRKGPSYAERMKGINLDPPGQPPESTQSRRPPQTGIGLLMSALGTSSDAERHLAEAKEALSEAQQRLQAYDGAIPARLLDPALICDSAYANRIEANFNGPAWDEFKAEITSSGGNVEPIKVRPIKGGQRADGCQYEAVYGHRRRRACQDLGLPVFALIDESITDQGLFEQMDRENRHRQNLSAWEQGRMYQNALRLGLWPSLRQMSEALGVNLSMASRCHALAQLPAEVVAAFSSPLVIQVRFSKPLSDALQRDPDGVLQRAREVAANPGLRDKLNPNDVLARLVGLVKTNNDQKIIIQDRQLATLKAGKQGRATLEFEAGALAPDHYQGLLDVIKAFLEQTAEPGAKD